MSMFNLSSPWVEHYRKIEAFFSMDEEVFVVYDDSKYEVKVYVNNSQKADALTKLLIPEIEFGNVTLHVTVIPSNKFPTANAGTNLFETAFKDNYHLAFIQVYSGIFASDITYVVFEKEVIQYFNDDISDINGFKSTLCEDIARDIFNVTQAGFPNTFFCTDID